LLDINVSVGGIRMQTGYTGQLQLNGFSLTVGGSDLDIQSGSLICGTGNVTLNGTTVLGGTGLINLGSGNAAFTQTFTQNGGSFNGNNASISFTGITLTGGVFTSSSGKITVSNTFTMNTPANFAHNNGAVEITGNNNDDITLSGAVNTSINFFKLIINKPVNTNFMGITGGDTVIVYDSAILINGGMNGGGVLNAKGNLWVQSTFDGNNNPVRMEGSGTSRLISDRSIGISSGASLVVNKVNTGDSLLIIRSSGSGTITDGQTGNAFTITRGIVAYPQNNRVQMNYNSLTIQANGRFVATADSLFNAGSHNTSAGGSFVHNNGVYVFTGGNRTYDVAAVPDTFYHVMLNKSGGADNLDFASGDSMVIRQNLTITDGQLNGTGTIGGIKLEGNLESSTLMTATNLGIEFTGSNNQTVLFNGTTSSNWNGDVLINKTGTGTITLLSAFNLNQGTSQVVTFTSGKMISTNTNILIIGGATSVTGANNNSFVSGPVRKDGNQTFVFPIGKGNIYAPVRISNFASSSGATQLRAEYIRANPDPTYSRTSKAGSITSLSTCEYWLLDRLNTSATVKVGLSYDASRSCGFQTFSSLKVIRWNGTQWVDHANDNLGPTGFVTSSANVTAFSPFTLGADIAVLPLQLKEWNAKIQNAKVVLNWSTASEANTSHFEIQRSANGIDFTTVKKINAAGFSQLLTNYNAVDETPLTGKSYYRLKMADRDFTFTYSSVATVFNESIHSVLKIYPNPVTGNSAVLELKQLTNQVLQVSLFDASGKMAMNKPLTVSSNGLIRLDGLQLLTKGIYTVRVQAKSQVLTAKLLIQ
jgi:hypothetical protein